MPYSPLVRHARAPFLAALALVAAAACAGDPTGTTLPGGGGGSPTASVALVRFPQPSITVQLGGDVAYPATAVDSLGRPLSGRAIVYQSLNTGIVRVTAAGVLQPAAAGIAVVVATSEGREAHLTVTVEERTPGSTVGSVGMWPTALEVVPGTIGRLTLSVRDASGAPMSVTPALVSTNPGVMTVDAVGNVRAVAVGTASIRATAEGVTTTTTVVVKGAPTSAFDIDVRFLGNPDPRLADVARRAAARWERIIVGDAPNVRVDSPANECDAGVPPINETVDDLVIYVRLDSIDGRGQVLGSAGPCYIRSSSYLPIVGVIHLDAADVAAMMDQGTADDVVTHEMGHVLGIGVLWNHDARTLMAGAGTDDPTFTGAAAKASAFSLGFTTSAAIGVAVENTGEVGTREGHWREAAFGRELMTGWINAAPNPLSAMTVRSLADMGYAVTETGADIFGPVTRTSAAAATTGGTSAIRGSLQVTGGPPVKIEDRLRTPIATVDRDGRMVKIED